MSVYPTHVGAAENVALHERAVHGARAVLGRLGRLRDVYHARVNPQARKQRLDPVYEGLALVRLARLVGAYLRGDFAAAANQGFVLHDHRISAPLILVSNSSFRPIVPRTPVSPPSLPKTFVIFTGTSVVVKVVLA
jgi:hypothetical protein